MGRWAIVAGVLGLLIANIELACSPEDADEGLGDSSSGGFMVDECPGQPPCDYCPDMAEACDLPCVDGELPCGNEIGESMACVAGIWACSEAPERDDDCTDVCSAASTCSEAGCSDGIELRFFSGSGFDAGAYEIVIQRDEQESACTFVISDDIGCALPPCVTDTTCGALYDLGGDVPQISMSLPISTSLNVEIARDGDVLVEATPAIEYELDAPNGPGCGPVCTVATIAIDVP